MENTSILAATIIVASLNLPSMLLDLCLPKKVSLPPVIALIPLLSLARCIRTMIIIAMLERTNSTIKAMQNPKYTSAAVAAIKPNIVITP